MRHLNLKFNSSNSNSLENNNIQISTVSFLAVILKVFRCEILFPFLLMCRKLVEVSVIPNRKNCSFKTQKIPYLNDIIPAE